MKSGEKDLAALDAHVERRIIAALEWFGEHFDSIVPIPLSGPWKGLFKFRVGDWRVMYGIETTSKVLVVHYIDHRGKVYKRKR